MPGGMTAYAFFVQTCREEYKKKHPDEGKVDFVDLTKKCADKWKTMTDKEKTRYNQMAESDQRRYELETQNLEQQGHSFDF